MNLEMCNECLNYKILNEDGRCQECKLKNKTTENFFKITVDCRDFDCVKKAIEVINDYVCENGMDEDGLLRCKHCNAVIVCGMPHY